MENITPERKVKWINQPALPIMKQVAWWLKTTNQKYPLTMDGWVRAARKFQEVTAPQN